MRKRHFHRVSAEEFGLGTGNEDIGSDAELTAVEIGNACHILQGFTGGHSVKGSHDGRSNIIRDLIIGLQNMCMAFRTQSMLQKCIDHLPCLPFGIEAGDGACSLFYQFGQFHCVTDVSTSLDMTKESSIDMTNVSSFKME